MKPIGALDFETEAIGPRPAYPPRPVGVALRSAGWKRARYLAWGHPEGNNTTLDAAQREVAAFVARHRVLCHNAGFDLDVAETHLGVAWPSEHDDTLISGFLVDPDSDSLSLKPLAQRYLGEPPTEQDTLRDWVLANVREATSKTWGAYISQAPVELVAPYAIGDVNRTLGLHAHFEAELAADSRFAGAYARELALTRVLIRMERRGIPVATRRLARDVPRYERVKTEIEAKLLDWLRVPKAARDEFAWSGPAFAEQFVRSRRVKALPLTDKGNPSTSAESLATVIPAAVAHEFEVRAQLQTCLSTFMLPWLEQARASGGLMFARFNQVRAGDEWGKKTGARTGRLSMSPNLQNVIRSDKDERVPRLRDYIVPGPYAGLAQRDYSQQELRLLAHYEDGPFLASYLANPDQDGHELVRALIRETTRIELERRPVKDLNFGMIYGQGINLTAEKMGLPKDEARRLQRAHAASLPGLPDLQEQLKERARNGEPIWTWGGRRYYCEPPKVINGRRRSFEYKMLNKLIQGSAADVTKQAMINYDALGDIAEENPLLLQVHDELILGLARRRDARRVHEALRDAMADVPGIAVPMRSDGKLGFVSWHQLKKVEW